MVRTESWRLRSRCTLSRSCSRTQLSPWKRRRSEFGGTASPGTPFCALGLLVFRGERGRALPGGGPPLTGLRSPGRSASARGSLSLSGSPAPARPRRLGPVERGEAGRAFEAEAASLDLLLLCLGIFS